MNKDHQQSKPKLANSRVPKTPRTRRGKLNKSAIKGTIGKPRKPRKPMENEGVLGLNANIKPRVAPGNGAPSANTNAGKARKSNTTNVMYTTYEDLEDDLHEVFQGCDAPQVVQKTKMEEVKEGEEGGTFGGKLNEKEFRRALKRKMNELK